MLVNPRIYQGGDWRVEDIIEPLALSVAGVHLSGWNPNAVRCRGNIPGRAIDRSSCVHGGLRSTNRRSRVACESVAAVPPIADRIRNANGIRYRLAIGAQVAFGSAQHFGNCVSADPSVKPREVFS